MKDQMRQNDRKVAKRNALQCLVRLEGRKVGSGLVASRIGTVASHFDPIVLFWRLASHSGTVASHSVPVASHSGSVASHSGAVASHSSLVASHSGFVVSHSSSVASHSGAVASHSSGNEYSKEI